MRLEVLAMVFTNNPSESDPEVAMTIDPDPDKCGLWLFVKGENGNSIHINPACDEEVNFAAVILSQLTGGSKEYHFNLIKAQCK